ncbi:MAG: tRNA lysidine(34) synthetase TilS [Ferruginibacter sp.]
MDLLEKFREYIKHHNLFQPKDKLLLAVSGGVDSVVLCELCKQASYDFIIAHCNFQLRGAESERDENFVRALGKKYEVEVLVRKFETEKYATENKLSIQVAARELRYAWFNELLEKTKIDSKSDIPDSQFLIPDYLLTAHHANDNMETLLMNFFKGTGINGLHGILPRQGNIVRPLLFAKKEALSQFATINNLEFMEDSSNVSDKYTRNYFRNQLIPGLQKVFPQVENNLLHNIERFREIESLYQQSVELNIKKLLEKKGNEIHIPVLKLLKTTALNTILYEIIKDYGFTAHQAEEAAALLKSDSGKYISSATHRIIKNRNWLIIAPNKTVEAENIFIEENDTQVVFQQGVIDMERLSTTNHPQGSVGKPSAGSFGQTTNFVAQLDAACIIFPLLLRRWKPGDYFYPLGMQKKKKLSRFLIDQKLSITQKEKTWVLEMDKKIIWVIGRRIDDRFKITGKTTSILQVSFHEK